MTIATLSDAQAITALTLVLERQGLTIDPFSQDEEEAHLREALAQPDIAGCVEPDPTATRGDLARTALSYLASQNEAAAAMIDRAVAIPPRHERDLAVLGIGALILLAFRADIEIAHEPGKGWKFRFRTKGLSDSTIGKLLSQLLGNFHNPNG